MQKMHWIRSLFLTSLVSLAACQAAAPVSVLRDDVSEGGTQQRDDLKSILQRLDQRFPRTVTSEFAVTSSARYASPTQGQLTDTPYATVAADHVDYVYSYIDSIATVDDLVERSRLVAVGEVRAIGRPHFNSEDGGFWEDALVDQEGYVPAATSIFRDVVFEIEDVLGAEDPAVAPGDLLTFAVRGGQLLVTLEDSEAQALEFEDGAGDYVFSAEAPVDLAVGERVLVFLDQKPIDGLYDGRYGERFEWFPTHELYYKFALDGSIASSESDPSLKIDLAALRARSSKAVATDAGPEPVKGVSYYEPHPVGDEGSVTEEDEPFEMPESQP